MKMKDLTCPKCGGECDQVSVDVGVGIEYGPVGCYECGWSSYEEYDRSEGTSSAQKRWDEDYGEGAYSVAQFGMAHPLRSTVKEV